jgi:2C-methyl-D-erythritol 2,4-cyclodiphosphate synthase
VDSILGALSLPDIGQLFPDNDPNWKGADSSIFMEEVTEFFALAVTALYKTVEIAPIMHI